MTEPATEVVDAVDENRYEIHRNGQLAGFALYQDRPGLRYFIHTEIFDSFGGLGLGSVLAERALTDTRTAGLRIVPLCPFIAKYLRKHPKFDDIVEWELARP